MGDDQEENIEMWKIKKVLHMCIEFVPFSFTYFYSFVMREFSFAPADETREKAPRRRRKRCDGVFFFSRLKRPFLLSARSLTPRARRGVRILILSFSSYRCTYLSRAHS